MRKALDGYEGGFKIDGRCITNLRYADDIVLIASTEEELQDIVNRLHEAATELGMKINGKKTEVMKVCDDTKPITVTVAGCNLSETKSFKYLGAMFNSEASCDEEIKSRLAIARQRLGKLVPIWKSCTSSSSRRKAFSRSIPPLRFVAKTSGLLPAAELRSLICPGRSDGSR